MTYAVQRTKDGDTNRNLDAIAKELAALRKMIPLLGGVLVEDQALSTSDAEVFHNLGREAEFYIVVKRSANAVVYDGATASTRPTQSLTLKASAAVTVSLVIF